MPAIILFLFGAVVAGYYALSKTTATLKGEHGIGHELSKTAASIPLIGQFAVSNDTVNRIAQAVSLAEGYGVPGSRPNRNNNPGDLKGNYAGIAISSDADGFDIYANAQDGWTALYRQVLLWLTNKSGVAGQDTTIRQLAQKYTTTQQSEWANNVSNALGVSPDTALGDV